MINALKTSSISWRITQARVIKMPGGEKRKSLYIGIPALHSSRIYKIWMNKGEEMEKQSEKELREVVKILEDIAATLNTHMKMGPIIIMHAMPLIKDGIEDAREKLGALIDEEKKLLDKGEQEQADDGLTHFGQAEFYFEKEWTNDQRYYVLVGWKNVAKKGELPKEYLGSECHFYHIDDSSPGIYIKDAKNSQIIRSGTRFTNREHMWLMDQLRFRSKVLHMVMEKVRGGERYKNESKGYEVLKI